MTFLDVCRALGLRTWMPGESHHVTSNWIGLDCPICSPGAARAKLGYNVRGGYLNCWTCGKLDLARTLARAAGRPVREVISLLAGLSRGAPPQQVERPTGTYDPPGHWPLTHPHGHACLARKYLRGRGFDPEELGRLWGVGATQPGELPFRLFIPVAQGGRNVSWTTRALDPRNGPRYRNAWPERESSPIKHCLYGLDYVRGACVVVEGPTDVWRVGPGAVATFGTQVTREQVLLLSKVPVRAVCFDREPDAQRAAARLCSLLETFPGATYLVRIESGDDPGEASEREITKIRKEFLED